MFIDFICPSIIPTFNDAFITGIAGNHSDFKRIVLQFGDAAFGLGFAVASAIFLTIWLCLYLRQPIKTVNDAN